MIIFGWRTRATTSHVMRKACPVCHADSDINFQNNKVWFTLFFVPIFPVKSAGNQSVCSRCGTVFPAALSESFASSPSTPFSDAPAYVTQTSSTAISALLLAILSPVLVCLCYASIPASIVAIVLGHLSLKQISTSEGRLGGRGLSIASLVLGYPVLLGSIVLMGYSLVLVYQRQNAPPMASSNATSTDDAGVLLDSNADAKGRFRAAEQMILALQGDAPGRGNSPESIRLAESFAETMLAVRETAFSESRDPIIQLSSGQFITYIELHDDRALFLVHVPEYRKFSKEAKEQLAQLAWTVAQSIVRDVLPEDAELAVALKGTVLYGDIMIGYATKHEPLRDNYRVGKKEELLAFFPERKRDQTGSEMSSAVPTDLASTPQSTMNAVTLDRSPHAQDGPKSLLAEAPAPDALSNTLSPAMLPALLPASELQDAAPGPTVVAVELDRDPTSHASSRQTPAPSPKRPRRERFAPFDPKLLVTPTIKIPKSGWGYESMAWSHDGRWLAAGKIDDTLTLFDTQTGATISEVKKLDGLNYFTALTFSFDDRFLIATTNAGESALLQVDQQGKLRHAGAMYRHAKGAQVLASSPRYLFVASGGKDGTIAWQTLTDPRQTKLIQHLKREPLAIWLPNEGVDARTISGESLLKFSLRDATVVAEHDLGIRSARAACFSLDGKQCVLVEYRDIYWVNCQSDVAAVKIHRADSDSFSSVAFHPNNRWIAVSGRGNVLFLDVIDRAPLARIDFDSMQSIKCLQFSPDGRKLAVSYQSSDTNIHLFEIDNR